MVDTTKGPSLGRSAPRSKTGCSTCLRRKIKCDEQRPKCRRCTNLQLNCEWAVRVRKPRTVASARAGTNTTQRSIRPLQSKQTLSVPSDALSTTDVASWASESSTGRPPANQVVLNWLNDSNCSQPSTPSTMNNVRLSISPTLSTKHIPCANSVLLSEHDRLCLEYYPSCTMVAGYLKPWRWSNLSYIYQITASSDPIVMRMILAIAGSEMHRLQVGARLSPDSEDVGLRHYNLAVRELSTVLGQEGPDDPKQRLEKLLAALLFMIDYEVRFGYSRQHLQLHLEGARTLYASYEKSLMALEGPQPMFSTAKDDEADDSNSPNLSILSSLLLLWISYIDAIGGQGLSSQSLLSKMSQTSLPPLKLERVYRRARIAGPHCWGEEYPEDAVLDDIENYRALEFLHYGFIIRSRIWQLALSKHRGEETTETPDGLFEEICELGEKYQDLILTARMSGANQRRRVYATVRCAASMYWANVLFHRITLCPLQASKKIHRIAVSSIMQIAHTDHGRERHSLAMQVWGLFMAGVDTEDGIHRDWILDRLTELRGLHLESQWTSDIMEMVIRGRTKGDTLVDLMPLLRLEDN